MAFWTWLTGGGKTTEKALDLAQTAVGGVVNGIDAAFFTDEEKSQAHAEAMRLHLEFIKTTVGESSIRSYTRRILAVSIMSCFLSLIMGSAVVWKFDPEWAAHLLKLAGQLAALAMTVAIFYFGWGVLRTYIGRK